MKHRLPKPKTTRPASTDSPDLRELSDKTAVDGALLPDAPRSTPPPLPGAAKPTESSTGSSLLMNDETSKNTNGNDGDAPFSFLSGTAAPAKDEKEDSFIQGSQIAEKIASTRRATPPPLPAKDKAKEPDKKDVPAKPEAKKEEKPKKDSGKKEPAKETKAEKKSPAGEKPPGDSSAFLIQTRGLVKQYGGRRVVNGVDIYVRPGEVVGLLGRNGAGKTTTFYMIVGLVTPTIGHVYMGDEDVTHMPMYRRARRGIGYLPQEESIFRKLTVEENLLAILETLPMTEEERDQRCDELIKDFGLEHVRENIAITLSGGEKRRVSIARALVTSPSLLMLDEPFSGVDPMAQHDIQDIILQLKERGLGVLITDHHVRETLSVVDRAYIIDEGRVLSEGSREFLINDPIAREIYLGHRFSM